jgi:hypothetical protein
MKSNSIYNSSEFLEITVFYKDSESKKKYTFSQSVGKLSIGRVNCNIIIENSNVSKKHCVIEYDTTINQWKIRDGYQNKPSTHGTWLMIDSKYEISTKTVAKLNNHTFLIEPVQS